MIYNIFLLWGVIMQTDWHFKYFCTVTSYYWIICYNYPDLGVWGWIWGILSGDANAAPDFFGSPDNVLQEKHLLQSPLGRVCLQSAFGLCTLLSRCRFVPEFLIPCRLVWIDGKWTCNISNCSAMYKVSRTHSGFSCPHMVKGGYRGRFALISFYYRLLT